MPAPLPLSARDVTDDEFVALAKTAGRALPIEQSPAWDAFDAAASGREHVGRVAIEGPEGAIALISLTRYRLRRFTYLWARHAPVMLTEATPAIERAVRDAVAGHIRGRWPDAVFVRLHASERGGDLMPVLQSVTYDRNVILDLTVEPEAFLAGLAKKFRYTVRQSLKHRDVTVTDETDLSRTDFDALYEVYRETAARDGFGIYDAGVYWAMIESLRPHARVYVARRSPSEATADALVNDAVVSDGVVSDGVVTDGVQPASSAEEGSRVLAWAIVTLYDGVATYFYAAANAEARDVDASVRLLWHALNDLRARGATRFDMGGIDSEIAPSLEGVGRFKRKWGAPVDVRAAWDLPLKPLTYRSLRFLLAVKRAVR